MMNPLSANQVQLLKLSFKALDRNDYATLFFEKLFTQYPQLRSLFPPHLDEQKEKLMSVLELVVHSFDEKIQGKFAIHDSLLIPLRHLGIQHEAKGIIPAHFQVTNQLMVETLEYVLGKVYSIEIKEAWSLALHHLTSAMLNTKIKVVPQPNTNTIREAFASLRNYFSKAV